MMSLLTLSVSAAFARADGETLNFLSATLGSHMVLQRAPSRATVWGVTAKGAIVTTTMSSSTSTSTFTSVADVNGTWRQLLPATPGNSQTAYNFPFTSTNSTSERAELTDVLFGDVYLCGGQSNME